MKKVLLISIFINLLFSTLLSSQESLDTTSLLVSYDIHGVLLNEDTKEALPYANIYILEKHKGVISNELGHFTIDVNGLDNSDTLRFQYIGFKTKLITIGELQASSHIYLKEDIINLSETLIFGTIPDLDAIVKGVLENKEKNYKATTSKKQCFIRERDQADINKFLLNYKKSDIPELDRGMIKHIEDMVPKHSTSYTDFLGDLYFIDEEEDSVKFKVDPIRTVSLKEEDIAELDQLEKVFENIVASTTEEEYWKIKSGIFGQKIDMDEANDDEEKKDSIAENQRKLSYFNRRIKYQLKYSSLDDKDQWEFLHSRGKYRYSLVGGTRINGEDVYIIDFEPKSRGLYEGRMYITINTFALLRADYEYAPDKTGTDINLLGVGYTENEFSGSIFFEKKADNYQLKYFSYKSGSKASIERNINLIKKKKRTFIDKTIMELKVRLDMALESHESIEYLVLSDDEISDETFRSIVQDKYMELIYVDQFDDNLWQGYSIIEPTQQMKEYKKKEIDYSKLN